MAIDQNGEAATPDEMVEATVAIVTAHLRTTTTSANRCRDSSSRSSRAICGIWSIRDPGSRAGRIRS